MSTASSIGAGVLTDTGTYLDKIITNTITEVTERKQRHKGIVQYEVPFSRPQFDFAATVSHGSVALIAEVKHASPSKGMLIDPFDPVDIAKTYAVNGATAISVLTDGKFFQGSLDDLRAVRTAVDLPILRKDFVIDEYQIMEAAAIGAKVVLLIVGILTDAKLFELLRDAHLHKMAALIEVHDEGELERALHWRRSRDVIGINNRDLRTFHTDLNTTKRLAAHLPPGIPFVAESGIHSVADVEAMAAAGARAVLVGEALITADDRAAKVRELSGVKAKL